MNFINLLWYFMIMSFLGWLYSGIYHFITEHRFYSNGFLTMPVCPSYGFGGILCYLVFHFLTNNLFIIFVGSSILLSVYCVLLGFITEKLLGCKPWDFSSQCLSIGSFITLPHALLFGLGGIFAVRMLIPVLDLILGLIPPLVSMIVVLSLCLLMLIDYVFSFISVIRLRRRVRKLNNLADLLGDDVDSQKLEELTKNYNRLFTDTLLRKRITLAFPELKSTAYVKQLTAKLEAVKAENMKHYTAVYEKKEDKPFASGLCLSKLFALFMIGSFIGTCIETVYALIVEGHFEFRVGVVYGPFIPVYGGGACLLTVVLYKLYKLSDTLIFIIGGVLGCFFEYICSWGQETFLGTVSWDYSDMPLNINGRTSLLYGLFWGFLGLVWVRYLYPFVSRQIEKIPKKYGSVVLTVLFFFMVYNAFITTGAIYRWNQRVQCKPPQTALGYYFDEHFNDKRMETLFPHMRDSDSLEELKDDQDKATVDEAIVPARKP